jgi:hypothetical protein
MSGQRPTAHEIMYAVQPRQEFNYPVWNGQTLARALIHAR